MTTLTLERALPVVDAAGRAGVPVLLRGGSGIGKTAGLSALANARGEHLEVVTASLYEAADFGGLPVVTNGRVDLAPMPWVRRVCAAGERDQPVCVFFDELNTAPPPVQAALLRVLLEGVSGDTPLPERTRFVAAINPTRASAGGWDLPAPVAGRFLHLDVGVDADQWVAGMLSGWSMTGATITCQTPTAAAAADALARVTAFITAHPHLLHAQPDDPAAAAGAWPSQRKWDWVAQILPAVPDELDLPIVAVEGLVGRVAADQFFTYLERLALPATVDVLADPSSVDWATEDAERVLAILNGCTSAAATDEESYAAAGAVLHAVVAAGRTDVATPIVKPYLAIAPAGVPRDTALLSAFAPLLTRAGKIS